MSIGSEVEEMIAGLELVKKFFKGADDEDVTPDLPTLAKANKQNFNKGDNTGITLSPILNGPWISADSEATTALGGNQVIAKIEASSQGNATGYTIWYRNITEP